MDKLKPVLEHKFWILYAFALIIPPVGWWMSSGEMATEISTREASVESSFGVANKTAGKSGIPNDRWTTAINDINAQQEKDLTHITYRLWKVQQELMTWPQEMKPFMEGLDFRGQPLDYNDKQNAQFLFAETGYREKVNELINILDPFNVRSQTGKIIIMNDALPLKPEKFSIRAEHPLYPEIWDSMEDLWLLRDLIDAIARVNRDSEALVDSNIRVIRELSLHGGAPTDAPVASWRARPSTKVARRVNKTNATFAPSSVFGDPPEGVDSPPEQRPRARYVHYDPATPFVTRGFYLEVIMDHRQVPELVAQLTKSSWPVEIKRLQIAEANEQDRKKPASELSDQEDTSGAETAVSALEDPYLAVVAIAGLMMLFNPVEPPADLEQPVEVETVAAEPTAAEPAVETTDSAADAPVADAGTVAETDAAAAADAEELKSDAADSAGESTTP